LRLFFLSSDLLYSVAAFFLSNSPIKCPGVLLLVAQMKR
jgi:hypothetical protein